MRLAATIKHRATDAEQRRALERGSSVFDVRHFNTLFTFFGHFFLELGSHHFPACLHEIEHMFSVLKHKPKRLMPKKLRLNESGERPKAEQEKNRKM